MAIVPMQIVFICSRYRGDVERNVLTAKFLCMMATRQGFVPIAPHLIYPQFLNDKEAAERETGRLCGLRILEKCDAMWLYGHDGISEGMLAEMELAIKRGIAINTNPLHPADRAVLDDMLGRTKKLPNGAVCAPSTEP